MDPASMDGKNGFPLNFDRLLMKVMAACPPVDQKYLTVEALTQKLEEQLAKHDPSRICSEAFKKSLKLFLKKLMDEIHRVMALVYACAQKSEMLENVGHKISGITDRWLEVFVRTCISRYHSKVFEAGTAIGVIGAQSIGEPATQMKLKTFHFAGVVSMNITRGVPRINEIINASKKISTPIITAELEACDNKHSAKLVRGRVEKTVLVKVAKRIEIVMTSRLASVVITLDLDIIKDAELYI